MPYKVIRAFADANDRSEEFPNGRLYEVGDYYPAKGKVTNKRILELATRANSAGAIFIAEDSDEEVSDDNVGGTTD